MKEVLRPIVAIAGLSAVAISQPILDALRRAPEFFVAQRADAVDVVVVALGLTFTAPFAFLAVLVLARAIHRKLVNPVTAAIIGTLAALLAVQLAYRLGISGWRGTAIAAVVAASGGLAAWLRFQGFRSFLYALSPAVAVVPLVFLVGGSWRSSAAASGEPGATSARATPVVIMVFDELTLVSLLDDSGQLNAARFPNLAALAADGVWFRNATAVSDYTRWALPSIVTGRYPSAGSTPTPQDHPNTVFSLVGRSHRLEVSEAVTSLCPRQLCLQGAPPRLDREGAMAADIAVVAAHVFFPPDARAGLPDLTQNWAGFAAADAASDDDSDIGAPPEDEPPGGPRVIRATRSWRLRWQRSQGTDHLGSAEAFIDGVSKDDLQPTLYFIHTLASHQPSRWLPSGQRIRNLQEIPGLTEGKWTDLEWLVAQHHQGELMQAALADTLVGRMRSRLAAAGIYDDALIIVTADHGVSFRPGDRSRNFAGSNAADILSVPLIVKPPVATSIVRGAVDDSNAETIDILPTVAHVLGVDPAWKLDGRSLIGADPPRPEKRFYINAATMHETYGPEALRASREEAARRQAQLFGLARWPVFTVPGFRDLVGRDVSSFGELGSIDSVRVTVENRNALANVDPKGPELPAQVVGAFVQADPASIARYVLAIALNGRIAATTRAWPGTLRWMAMLPDDAWRAGKNDVDVFVVNPSHPDQILRPRS